MLITDPITAKLLPDGDADIASWASTDAFESGVAAVISGVRQRLLLIRGEWFADLDAGVPWFERDNVPAAAAILGGRFDAARVRAPILRAILNTPGVLRVVSLDVSFDAAARHVRITWAASTVFGDTPTSTALVS